MAIFGSKTKEEKKEVKAEKTVSKSAGVSKKDLSSVIIGPRITEKATFSADSKVYVFDIASKATKNDVAMAVEQIYKVKPIKVSTAKVPSKKIFYRGNRGVKSGGKKAYVYVSGKDKIEIV